MQEDAPVCSLKTFTTYSSTCLAKCMEDDVQLQNGKCEDMCSCPAVQLPFHHCTADICTLGPAFICIADVGIVRCILLPDWSYIYDNCLKDILHHSV